MTDEKEIKEIESKEQTSIFMKIIGSIIPIVSYGIIISMFLDAAINPENNIRFIYSYALFIFIAEFFSIHSSGMLSAPFPIKLIILLTYMVFIVTFSIALKAFYPALILTLSITAKIFGDNDILKTGKTLAVNVLIFLGTTFFVAFSSLPLKLLKFSPEVLSNTPSNASGMFVDTPETLIVWGIMYFTLMLSVQLILPFIKEKKKEKELVEE